MFIVWFSLVLTIVLYVHAVIALACCLLSMYFEKTLLLDRSRSAVLAFFLLFLLFAYFGTKALMGTIKVWHELGPPAQKARN